MIQNLDKIRLTGYGIKWALRHRSGKTKVHHQQAKPKPKLGKRAHATGVSGETVDGFFDTEGIEKGRKSQKLERLDLHNSTLEDAEPELAVFLEQCARRNQRRVLIIHGPGLHSEPGSPTIKSKIGEWLKQRPEVQDFAPAGDNDGALCVQLKNCSR